MGTIVINAHQGFVPVALITHILLLFYFIQGFANPLVQMVLTKTQQVAVKLAMLLVPLAMVHPIQPALPAPATTN